MNAHTSCGASVQEKAYERCFLDGRLHACNGYVLRMQGGRPSKEGRKIMPSLHARKTWLVIRRFRVYRTFSCW